jgi:transposase
MDLTDQQWALVQPIISERHQPSPSNSTVGGRPPIDPRPILDGILWKIRNAVPWADLPTCYPSHQTCFRRYRLWQSAGTLNKIFYTLFRDLLQRGGSDPQHALRDGSITITLQENRYLVLAAAELLDTWQLSTALVFIQIALTRLKQQPSRTLTTS